MATKTTQSHPSTGGAPASLTSWYSSNHSPRKGSAASVQANETKKVLDPFLKRELAGTIFEVELDQFVSTFFPCALPEQEKYSAAAEACLADWVANKTNKVPWERLKSATEAVGIVGMGERNDEDEDGSGVGKEEDGPAEPPRITDDDELAGYRVTDEDDEDADDGEDGDNSSDLSYKLTSSNQAKKPKKRKKPKKFKKSGKSTLSPTFMSVATARNELQMYTPLLELLEFIRVFFVKKDLSNDEAWPQPTNPWPVVDPAPRVLNMERKFVDCHSQTIRYANDHTYPTPDLRLDLALVLADPDLDSNPSPQQATSSSRRPLKPSKTTTRERSVVWKDVKVAIEVKFSDEFDTRLVTQVARYARAIKFDQLDRNFSYTITISHRHCRILRWDSTACYTTTPLLWQDNPLEFITLIARIASLSPSDLGYDTSFSNAGRVHSRWDMSERRSLMRTTLTICPEPSPVNKEIYHRGDTPPSNTESPETSARTFLLDDVIAMARNGNFSRSTVVWKAHEILSSKIDDHAVAIKQNHQDDTRIHEGTFYEQAEKHPYVPLLRGKRQTPVHHVARLLCSQVVDHTHYPRRHLAPAIKGCYKYQRKRTKPGAAVGKPPENPVNPLDKAKTVLYDDAVYEDLIEELMGGSEADAEVGPGAGLLNVVKGASDGDNIREAGDGADIREAGDGADVHGASDGADVHEAGEHEAEAAEDVDPHEAGEHEVSMAYSAYTKEIAWQDEGMRWTLDKQTKVPSFERALLRLVFIDVGQDLTKAKNMEFLLSAVHGCLCGIQQLWTSRILHRDISIGNLLMTENGKGFLIDLGLAVLLAEPGVEEKPRDARAHHHLTGTLPFIAVELLDDFALEPPKHDLCHDLESLFWVLLWVCITTPEAKDDPWSSQTLHRLSGSTEDLVWMAKTLVLSEVERIQIVGPYREFTSLLQDFGRLCQGRGEKACTFEQVDALFITKKVELMLARRRAEGKGGPSAAVQSAATPPVLGQATRKRQVIRDKDDDQPSKRSKGSDDD